MSVLASIIEGVREDLAERQRRVPLSEIRRAAREAPAPIDLVAHLRSRESLGVISEVKRSSPSKGSLAPITDAAALAREYQAGGASAISVLTEARRFHGSLDDLRAVSAATTVPVLRKDFMLEDYQVYEARAHGASVILLIVAALEDPQLAHMYALARDLGMRVLVETHTREELERALATEAELIGVNARDLTTLAVDLEKAVGLLEHVPSTRLAVAESAVTTLADVQRYAQAGADAVLVGEALVIHADPRQAVADFSAVPRTGRARVYEGNKP